MSARLTCRAATAAGIAAGYAADLRFGDPRRGHPVAVFGAAAAALERRLWARSRRRGLLYTAATAGGATALGTVLAAATREHPAGRFATTAVTTWAVLGGSGLAAEGGEMARLLDAGDLPGARARLSHLCGRDPAGLDAAALARAATESIAENTSDAVVAPLFWGGVAGLPGLLGYRALNTLDAMVGHRSPRYAEFGWASARADDLANLVPARLSAAAAVLCAPLVAGAPAASLRAWRRDAHRHPSPNAGSVEAAFAGALGVRLGGVNSYGGRVEDRGPLGAGPPPDTADLRRAVRLSRLVGATALAVGVGLAGSRPPWRHRASGRT
ncbi:cobalamin biosynthesis protein [Amycolatopsis marina]|uniref:cobalamin biosynthesis protein n=1 Tax=Amycolatopsis marina TaxID=490629 RepID=UPI003CCC05A1